MTKQKADAKCTGQYIPYNHVEFNVNTVKLSIINFLTIKRSISSIGSLSISSTSFAN